MVYEKLVQILNRKLDLSLVTMTSLDCMSVGYFLKCFLRNSRKIILNLSNCSINGHSIGLIIGEHSSAGALHGVTVLDISENMIGNDGIAHIATALQINTTMRKLRISSCSISDEGAESLAGALGAEYQT